MTNEEFIEKWNVAYENKEQQLEFASEMLNDLKALSVSPADFPKLTDKDCEDIGLMCTHSEASAAEMRLVEKGAKKAREWYENKFKLLAIHCDADFLRAIELLEKVRTYPHLPVVLDFNIMNFLESMKDKNLAQEKQEIPNDYEIEKFVIKESGYDPDITFSQLGDSQLAMALEMFNLLREFKKTFGNPSHR